jgi:hypothetical protein
MVLHTKSTDFLKYKFSVPYNSIIKQNLKIVKSALIAKQPSKHSTTQEDNQDNISSPKS